jgi:hypothetical protein
VSRATVDVDLLTVDTKALQADPWTGFGAGNISVRVLEGDFDDPLAGSVRLETLYARDREDLEALPESWLGYFRQQMEKLGA